MSATAPTKVCQICHQDCSKRPRTKDAQGRYFCEACLEQRKAEQALLAGAAPARPAPKAKPASDLDDVESPFDAGLDVGAPAGFWESTPAAPATAAVSANNCPKCGTAMFAGAAVCAACGHNTRRGRSDSAAAAAGAAGGAVASAAGTAAKFAGKGAMRLALWLIAAGVGGVIGLALWLGVAYATGYEFSLLAWVVGAIVGGAIMLTGASHLNPISGLIAAAVTFFCVAGWKFVLVSMINSAPQPPPEQVDLNSPAFDDVVLRELARETAEQLTSKGQRNAWPGGKPRARFGDDGSEPPLEFAEFPPSTQKETMKRWEAMPDKEKARRRHAARDLVKQDTAKVAEAINPLGDPRQAIFLVIALLLGCATAYKMGSGTSGGD